MSKYVIMLLTVLILSCNTPKEKIQAQDTKNTNSELLSKPENKPIYGIPKLDLKGANNLVELPLHCMNTEYPNRLSQTLGGDEDLKSPSTLHPAFYGCFDWHSAVHGHWSLVSLLKQFPEINDAEGIKQKLLQNISKENIETEVAYFFGKHNKSYERTYGWA